MRELEEGVYLNIDLQASEENKEENMFYYDPFEKTLFIKAIPKFITRWELSFFINSLEFLMIFFRGCNQQFARIR